MTSTNLSTFKTIDIEFTDLVYEIRDGIHGGRKKIINGINGYFKSGEMTVVMGPSGAGKSTLFNLLTGFDKKKRTKEGLKGNINYIDNERRNITWNEYNRHSCYISQDDHLSNLCTVYEAMTISANLKLNKDVDLRTRITIIDDILSTLDLIKNKRTFVERLSAGERKRLSIALELVDDPSVIFLDEPTTGLDSYLSLQCVKLLRRLTRNYKTIICTIHQPSAAIYETFDHVYLLAGGRCMYEGAPCNTVEYFANLDLPKCPIYHNPADYMLEIVNMEYGNYVDRLAETIERNKKEIWRGVKDRSIIDRRHRDDVSVEKGNVAFKMKKPREYDRFWTLVDRSLRRFNRDWSLVYHKIILHITMGTLFGLFFLKVGVNCHETEGSIKFLVILSLFLSYASILSAVLRIPSELAMIRKEIFNNWYQFRTYYLALTITDLPIQIFQSILSSTISYVLTGQPFEWNRFAMFIGIAAATISIADSFGLVIGALLNPINGTFVASIVIAILLLFDGCIILFKDMPRYLYYCSYLNFSRYSLQGFIQSVYGFGRGKFQNIDDLDYCQYLDPKIIFNELLMDDDKYFLNLSILIVFFIFFRCVSYITMKRNLSSA